MNVSEKVKSIRANMGSMVSGTALRVSAAGVAVLGFASAHAALPTAASDAITGLQTDGTSLIALGWPLAAALAGGLALIGVFKKVLSKAV